MAAATAALSRLRAPAVAAGGVNLVIGFGSELWRAVAPDQAPADLAPFTPIGAARRPSRARHPARLLAVDQRQLAGRRLRARPRRRPGARRRGGAGHRAAVLRAPRQPGPTGFIDGTANPMTHEAPEAALIPDGQPGAGGSHVLVMRWVHDLDAFERAAGRGAAAGVRPHQARPAASWRATRNRRTAHIARVEITDEAGEELPIYRRSVPYGTVAEHGLYFVAFSADRTRFDRMLARMFGLEPMASTTASPISRARSPAPSTSRPRSPCWPSWPSAGGRHRGRRQFNVSCRGHRCWVSSRSAAE